MSSKALQTFEHAIQDAIDLLAHFDSLNKKPPPPEIGVLKRASLIMALAALEVYFEDLLVESVTALCDKSSSNARLSEFFQTSLEKEIKTFHTPSTDRIRPIFAKYLGCDVTEAWSWNQYDPAKARSELNRLAKKKGRYRAQVMAASSRAANAARCYPRCNAQAHPFYQGACKGN